MSTESLENFLRNNVWVIDSVAELCHEVNRAYCVAIGDDSQLSWSEAPDWQKESVKKGVIARFLSPMTPEQSHESWMKEKIDTGWSYGPIKNRETKQHPCMLPYDQLPAEQRVKDYLFAAVVANFRSAVERNM